MKRHHWYLVGFAAFAELLQLIDASWSMMGRL